MKLSVKWRFNIFRNTLKQVNIVPSVHPEDKYNVFESFVTYNCYTMVKFVKSTKFTILQKKN